MPVWNVELRGAMTPELEAELANQGLCAASMSQSLRGSESHALQVHAATASEAVARAESATADAPVVVKSAIGPVRA